MSRQAFTVVGRRFHSCFLVSLMFFLSAGDVSCLAVTAPVSLVSNGDVSPKTKVIEVVSTKTDSGVSKTFSFAGAKQPAGSIASSLDGGKNNIGSIFRRINAGFRSTFLPVGFPYRTPPGYLSFSVWSWIQDLSTQLRSVLATQRVLEGVGVGREGATAISALMNYIVRDGCGMGASLLFTSVSSSRFKSDVKRWRLFADLMVDIGITLEVAATIVPRALFLPMICVGNMCKSICGVAAGACDGAINLHWATGSDISDINAKFRAQHTVTGSVGLVFAALFARSVSTVQELSLWMLYSVLTALHIFANMKCMRLIAFDSLNTERMNLVASEFFQWWDTNQSQEGSQTSVVYKNDTTITYTGSRVPLSSPEEISREEPLFFFKRIRTAKHTTKFPIYFGVSFDEFSKRAQKSMQELEELVHAATAIDQKYLIAVRPSRRRGHRTVVSLSSDATPRDEAKAYFHALLLNQELKKDPEGTSVDETEKTVARKLDLQWSAFEKGSALSGWDLSKTVLRTAGYEISLQSQGV